MFGEITTLRGRDMAVNLIVFVMPNFDMILVIDFLSRYEVKIDRKKKKVRFYLDDGFS